MGCSNSKDSTVVAAQKTTPQKEENDIDVSKETPNKTEATATQQPKNADSAKSEKRNQPPVRSTNRVEDYYALNEELGRGAFSVVKKARDRNTGDIVAVKTIDKKHVEESDLVLLNREIDIMRRLSHPNVLKLIEVFETKETFSIVMELVTGGELFYKIVEKGNYSEKDAADIIRQILHGVEYLHAQGICHRDLKPENLLCSEESGYNPFRVIIADFGLSKAFNGGEALETSCGTPDYVAPEVITLEHSYDSSVDIWSLGVVAYVLLCGFSPFLSSSEHGLFDKIIKCEYDFPDPEWTNISKNAKDLIKHMIVKDPAKRYTATQCLQHPWLIESNETSSLGKISEKMTTYNETRRNSYKKN